MADFSRQRTISVSLASLAEPVALRAAWSLARSNGPSASNIAGPTGPDLVGLEVWGNLLRHSLTVVSSPWVRIEMVAVHDVIDLDTYSVERLADHVLARMRLGADVADPPLLEMRRVAVRWIPQARDPSVWSARSL